MLGSADLECNGADALSCRSGVLHSRRGGAGELRRRKYTMRAVEEVPAKWWSRTQTLQEIQSEDDEDAREILIQGPLQEHQLLFLWQWRWVVLDQKELRIYRSEDAFLSAPERPLRRYGITTFHVALDLDSPSVLVCMHADTGALSMLLRSGPGHVWEEVAASKLWLRMFASACRSAVSA